jgi:adenosylhomocysteinase
MERAAEIGDLFCTATGDKNVIARAHLERMKDGAILSNRATSTSRSRSRRCGRSRPRRAGGEFVEEFTLADGRRVYLSRGQARQPRRRRGHTALVMDMSFANQALSPSG